MKRFLLSLLPVLFLGSCLKDARNKVNRINGIKWSGAYAISAVNADLNLDDAIDMVSDLTGISSYTDDVLYFSYQETELSKYAWEMFPLNDQNGTSSTSMSPTEEATLIGTGMVAVNKTFIFPYVVTNIPELDSIQFSKGNLSLDFFNNYNHPCTGTISMMDMRKGGAVVKYTFSVAANSSHSVTDVLTDMALDLTKGGVGYNELRISLSLNYTNSGGGFSGLDNLGITYNFSNMNFKRIYGYFGNFNILDGNDSMALSIFDEGLKYGSYSFQDPRLKLKYTHNTGVPMQMSINGLWGYKSGSSTAISGYTTNNNITEITKGNEGKTLVDSIMVTKSTGNIQSVIDGQPTHIIYDFDITTNPGGPVKRNFFIAESQIKVVVSLELPFHGLATKVQITDTSDFELNLDGAEEVIEWLNFRFDITNEMPVSLGFQAYFLDAGGAVLDSVFQPFRFFATAANVDGSGNVISAYNDKYDVEFYKDKISRIVKAKKLVFRAFLNTAEVAGNQVPVKITRNQHLKIKLGVHTKLSVDETF